MTSRPSLLPREHGAYAELAFPLLTGLALALPTLPTLGLAVSAIALFLAHEPIAVLLGVRGQRRLSQSGGAAKHRAAYLLVFSGVSGLLGAVGAGQTIWPASLFPLVGTALLVPLLPKGRHKTLVGEVLVVTVFASLVLPLAASSGAEPSRAAWAALVWWLSFFLGTLEVHAIKARHKDTGRSRWTRWGSPAASAAAVAGCLAGITFGAPAAGWPAMALLPPAAGILALGLLRVHPRRLKRVGWTLVAANTLAFFLILFGSR